MQIWPCVNMPMYVNTNMQCVHIVCMTRLCFVDTHNTHWLHKIDKYLFVRLNSSRLFLSCHEQLTRRMYITLLIVTKLLYCSFYGIRCSFLYKKTCCCLFVSFLQYSYDSHFSAFKFHIFHNGIRLFCLKWKELKWL